MSPGPAPSSQLGFSRVFLSFRVFLQSRDLRRRPMDPGRLPARRILARGLLFSGSGRGSVTEPGHRGEKPASRPVGELRFHSRARRTDGGSASKAARGAIFSGVGGNRQTHTATAAQHKRPPLGGGGMTIPEQRGICMGAGGRSDLRPAQDRTMPFYIFMEEETFHTERKKYI